MTHILPILCLLIFVFFLEIRLKQEHIELEQKFKIIKEEILKNREKIKENKEVISKIK